MKQIVYWGFTLLVMSAGQNDNIQAVDMIRTKCEKRGVESHGFKNYQPNSSDIVLDII